MSYYYAPNAHLNGYSFPKFSGWLEAILGKVETNRLLDPEGSKRRTAVALVRRPIK